MELRRAKVCYKNRLEGKLQQKDPQEIWTGVRDITGMEREQWRGQRKVQVS